jgi:Rps23 Pro-64 3,4-dihydroxylase Tpa1-like proline 4-hydroxylase
MLKMAGPLLVLITCVIALSNASTTTTTHTTTTCSDTSDAVSNAVSDAVSDAVSNSISNTTITNKRVIQRIQSNNDVEVVIVSNFLPENIAESWRTQLVTEWERDAHIDTNRNSTARSKSAFMYATNELNTKLKSKDDIVTRRNNVWQKKLRGQFSYGKWELDLSHVLLQEVKDFMLKNETAAFVAETLALKEEEIIDTKKLSDVFITHFSPGDFLSAHNDFYSGNFAFVISLTAGLEGKEWSQEVHGGQLALLCDDDDKRSPYPALCHHIPPIFNQLVLFRTRPGPYHTVEVVGAEGYESGFRRLAVTGWYMTETPNFTEEELRERDAMAGKTVKKSYRKKMKASEF